MRLLIVDLAELGRHTVKRNERGRQTKQRPWLRRPSYISHEFVEV